MLTSTSLQTIGEDADVYEISIPVLVSDTLSVDSINKDVFNDAKEVLCFDLADKDSLNEIYESTLMNTDNSTKKGDNLTDKEKIKAIKKAGYYSVWEASTSLLTSSLVSYRVEAGEYCGGAHPNFASYGLNYSLKEKSVSAGIGKEDTVTSISLSDIFLSYKDNVSNIMDIVREKVKADTNNDECAEVLDNEIETYLQDFSKQKDTNGGNPFSFALNQNGIEVLSFGLPHAEAPCEPDVIISYSDFKGMVDPQFLKKLK